MTPSAELQRPPIQSVDEAISLILRHPVPDMQLYWARKMTRLLDYKVLKNKMTLAQRQEYLALLDPILTNHSS